MARRKHGETHDEAEPMSEGLGAEGQMALGKCLSSGMPADAEAKLSAIPNLDWTKVWALVAKLQAPPYNLTIGLLWSIIMEAYHTFFGGSGEPADPEMDPNAPIQG